jgi:hypothetical protein
VSILGIGTFRPFLGGSVLGLFWDLGFSGYRGFLGIGVLGLFRGYLF